MRRNKKESEGIRGDRREYEGGIRRNREREEGTLWNKQERAGIRRNRKEGEGMGGEKKEQEGRAQEAGVGGRPIRSTHSIHEKGTRDNRPPPPDPRRSFSLVEIIT